MLSHVDAMIQDEQFDRQFRFGLLKVIIDLGNADEFSSAGRAVNERRYLSFDANFTGFSHVNIVQHRPVTGERFQERIHRFRQLIEMFLGVNDAFVRTVMRMKLVGIMKKKLFRQFEKKRIDDDPSVLCVAWVERMETTTQDEEV